MGRTGERAWSCQLGVDGLNQASGFGGSCIPIGWIEAPGANSDYRELPDGGWATYGYDGLDRLISAVTGSNSWGYGYDGVGNRLTSTAGAASTSDWPTLITLVLAMPFQAASSR